MRFFGLVIGALWVAAGVFLLAYRDDFDERPFIGLGINAIVAGSAFALVFSFAGIFAEAWLENTEQESG
jgi:hypothetical protein